KWAPDSEKSPQRFSPSRGDGFSMLAEDSILPPHSATHPVWQGAPFLVVYCYGTRLTQRPWIANRGPHIGTSDFYARLAFSSMMALCAAQPPLYKSSFKNNL
ncbi:MAG: hypothetical protein KDE54_24630, partial [Caldilineaceae bacterium]|nr:hypothetical protein [Caldilineaceae bacterium]